MSIYLTFFLINKESVSNNNIFTGNKESVLQHIYYRQILTKMRRNLSENCSPEMTIKDSSSFSYLTKTLSTLVDFFLLSSIVWYSVLPLKKRN